MNDLLIKVGILNLQFGARVYRRILAKAKAAFQLFGLGARNSQSDANVIRDVNAPHPNDRIESLARGELSCKLRVVASETIAGPS